VPGGPGSRRGRGSQPGPWGPEDLRVAVVFLRSLRGWSQTEMARAAGMDKSRISLYEQGRKVPSPRSLGKLVAAAGLPLPVFESVVSFIRRVRAAAAPPSGSLLAGADPADPADSTPALGAAGAAGAAAFAALADLRGAAVPSISPARAATGDAAAEIARAVAEAVEVAAAEALADLALGGPGAPPR
jgi:transcriptional regulator with XRE-family HTH domain